MDFKTVILMLAVGSFSFGLLILLFKFSLGKPQLAPYWVEAKMLKAAGSLLLYLHADSFDILSMVANTALLLGCAYEAWAVRVLNGLTVRRRLHLWAASAIVALSAAFFYLKEPYRAGAYFLGHSILYFLPGIFLLRYSDAKFSLRIMLGISYSVTSAVYLASAVLYFASSEFALSAGQGAILALVSGTGFCNFLFSGFILLMIAKERSDMELHRFRRIVEIANEGVMMFDENYKILYANRHMAKMLGYTTDELVGISYESLFPPDMLEVYHEQKALRRLGKDSVYESCLYTKDGVRRWFLVSGTAICDESGEFEGSFGVFTDINERKETELQLVESNRILTELTYQDGLTGIANRRCFDATLEREYQRLAGSSAMLSVIIIDIDHFKEYNDFYGHPKGDECLREVGRAIASSIRRGGDLAARYGGEEFACILPDTDLESAVKTAERIRQRIAELEIEHRASKVSDHVTASLGVATVRCSPRRSPAEIVAAADKQLYKAKLSRNTVEFTLLADER